MAETAHTLPLSEQNWARIIAYAWQHPDFCDFLERDVGAAVRFLQQTVPEFKDIRFDLIDAIPPRPIGVSNEELQRVVSGEMMVIPDRFAKF